MTLEASGVNEDPVLVRRATCPAFESVPRVALVFRWIFTQRVTIPLFLTALRLFLVQISLDSNCKSADHPRNDGLNACKWEPLAENRSTGIIISRRSVENERFSRIIIRSSVHYRSNWSNYSDSNRSDSFQLCANDRLFDCSTWNAWLFTSGK